MTPLALARGVIEPTDGTSRARTRCRNSPSNPLPVPRATEPRQSLRLQAGFCLRGALPRRPLLSAYCSGAKGWPALHPTEMRINVEPKPYLHLSKNKTPSGDLHRSRRGNAASLLEVDQTVSMPSLRRRARNLCTRPLHRVGHGCRISAAARTALDEVNQMKFYSIGRPPVTAMVAPET